jgi:hypothetical protein
VGKESIANSCRAEEKRNVPVLVGVIVRDVTVPELDLSADVSRPRGSLTREEMKE